MALHVLRHVEAQELDAEAGGELLGDLGLADAGRAGEQVGADRLLGVAQAGAGELDRRGQRLDRLVLAVDDPLEGLLSRCASTSASSFETVFGGMRAMVAMVASISLTPMVFLRRFSGHQHLRGAGLVDHVDRLVGQLAVVDVARRQLHRRLDGVVGVAELVELLEIGLQALHDLDRVRDRRLVDVDLLEAADERPVLLEVLAVLLVGGRADAAQRAGGERRLQQVRRVHRAAGGGAGADHRVDLVDEHDGVRVRLDLLDDLLQALLEIAAVAGAGEQRAHVEGEDGGVLEHLRHLALDDLAGEALGDGGLADAGIADQERVVLLPAAEDLDRALDLGLAADQRVDLAVLRLLVEVDAVGVERVALLLRALAESSPVGRSFDSSSAPRGGRLSVRPGRLAMPWLM